MRFDTIARKWLQYKKTVHPDEKNIFGLTEYMLVSGCSLLAGRCAIFVVLCGVLS